MTNTKVNSYNQKLNNIKNQMIDGAYLVLILTAIPSIFTSYIFMNYIYSTGNFVVFMLTGLSVIVLIYLLRKHIHYLVRVWLMVSLLFVAGLLMMIFNIYVSSGILYLYTSVVLVILHFHERAAKPFFFSSIVVITITGIMTTLRGPDFGNNIFHIATSLRQDWTMLIFSYTIILSMLIRSLLTLNKGLFNTLEDLVDQHMIVEKLAYFDELTELPNREKFQKTISDLVEKTKDDHYAMKSFQVIHLNFDDFKMINTRIGHMNGNEVIKQFSKILKSRLKNTIEIARIGGDEFGVILSNTDEHGLETFYNIVADVCDETIKSFQSLSKLTCSAGISVYPKDGVTFESLLEHAETALVTAKRQGSNIFVVYDDNLREVILEQTEMLEALEIALETEELFIEYQPKYSVLTGEIFSFEALARWHSTKYGIVSPDVFIPIMESSGLIIEFGRNVMKQALLELKKWHNQGFKDLTMAVNVSAIQFNESNFVNDVLSVLEEVKMKPEYLEIEITESLLIHDFDEVTRKLEEFSSFGISIALDDFGVGYSSLNYLRVLPIDTLKIDKSFVDVITNPLQDEVILSTIVSLAHALDLKVVAEGIEDEQQKQFLEANHCDYMQGFYFSKPLKSKKITDLLEKQKRHTFEEVCG